MAVQRSLLLLLLFTASLGYKVLGETRDEYPCPEADAIKPCLCIRKDDYLYLNCSNVESDTQLQDVFKAPFPFTHFTELTIIAKPEDPRINLVMLQNNVFQNITFSNVRISHTNLELIYPNVFDKSAPMLETLAVTDNKLIYFPFEVVNRAPLLTDLRVFRNNLQHIGDIASDNLKYLQVSYNPEFMYNDDALEKLPNLEYFVANDIHLSHVAAKTFIHNTKLKYVDLSHNNLQKLYADSFSFTSPIEEIRLNNNDISVVEFNAFQGLGTGSKTFLWLHNNHVTSLTQSVWEPVFNSVSSGVRSFVFDNNPFLCECNVLWLVSNDKHRDTISRGTICVDTKTDILDVDVDFLLDNC